MLNYSDKTLDKKEKEILEKHSLIKFRDDVIIEKIEDIFDKLFNKSLRTYHLNNEVHCESGRGRSYYDGFLLCKHYFPNITYKEMYRKLYSLVESQNAEHKQTGFWNPGNKPAFVTCLTIGRARFIGRLKL